MAVMLSCEIQQLFVCLLLDTGEIQEHTFASESAQCPAALGVK